MNKLRLRDHGFTLLEVLVALAVLAFALIGLIRAAGLGANAQSHVADVTVANWVAQNALAEIRLSQKDLANGGRNGIASMAKRSWRWEAQIESTPEPSLKRIDIKVYIDTDLAAPRASLSGFSRP